DLSLMAEGMQSDLRHAFLMFAADFANPIYRDSPLFAEAVRRYEPLKGETAREVIGQTKRIVEIVAILGGQWPHSSYMVPGGTTSVPSGADLLQCRHVLSRHRQWYEQRVLGCTLDRWLAVGSCADLQQWLDEAPTHRDSDLGFFVRFGLAHGLDRIGRGPGNFLSVGSLPMPEDTAVRGRRSGNRLFPAGFGHTGTISDFSSAGVLEHVAYSWFEDYEGGLHPFDGQTRPYATGQEGKKYSWAKAPRYQGLPAETGPLAELLVAGHPLFVDLVDRQGPSVFARQLARIVRQAELIPAMETWIAEITEGGKFYASPGKITQGEGVGLVQAPRGALGHWVKIADGKIQHYQIITPTAWNASPRDSDGVRGPWEQALMGTSIRDQSNPIEVGHVVRSFDACLVCTVH
ncbi:MAG: nickel-dependent hydrogenase large subunit, partial [Planctomycetes bacterium]|nr:nickel-dependent hydrogenase large subunit [Planctomycetota bacterium]